jgi:hypothetical protein
MSIGNISGTTADSFELGNAGPILKNDAGVLAVRDPDDLAYASVKAGPPIGPDELVNLQYLTDVAAARFACCCYFGGDMDLAGNFIRANGESNLADVSSGDRTKSPVPVNGTLVYLVYWTAAADATSQIKIHLNGVVVDTLLLSPGVGSLAINIPVSVGDYIEIEYDAGTPPGRSIMYFNLRR